MKKDDNSKKFVKMTVLVRPHEFSQFLRIPRRTLIAMPRAIFSHEGNILVGYVLEIVEEQQKFQGDV